jgi:hypothetical protein
MVVPAYGVGSMAVWPIKYCEALIYPFYWYGLILSKRNPGLGMNNSDNGDGHKPASL